MVQFTPKMQVSWIGMPYPRFQSSQQDPMPISTRNEGTKPTTQNICCQSFGEYLFNTTLHGLKYVGDKTITLLER